MPFRIVWRLLKAGTLDRDIDLEHALRTFLGEEAGPHAGGPEYDS
jgi:hypothetical protein